MNDLWNWISGFIFPLRCLGCGIYDVTLCATCQATIPKRREQECIVCKRSRPDGTPCLSCAPHTMVDRLFIAGQADDPLLSRAIWSLKYSGMRDLVAPLSDYMVHALAEHGLTRHSFTDNPLFIPVPLHPRRHQERGFNQSALIAHHLAARMAMIYMEGILKRVRHTESQVKTASRWERLENMRNAFVGTQSDLVANRSIILIDDVCTTGATLDACARALKELGARSVFAIVLARG